MSIIDWPFNDWLHNVSLAALSSPDTVRASYDIARLAIERGVPGDFVECGVFGGAQCAAMARAIMDCNNAQPGPWCYAAKLATDPPSMASMYFCTLPPGHPGNHVAHLGGTGDPVHEWEQSKINSTRRVHLFDSFDGIPAPGEHDTDIEPGMHAAFADQTRCTLEDCKNHFREWGIPDELLCWHQGPFSETVLNDNLGYGCELEHIAVLRLDGDLYESTKVCLEHLYPLLSPGGWCIIDDMGLVGARKAVDEYMANLSRPTYWQRSK